MIDKWRPLLLTAAFTVTLGVGAATAQTVIVRHVPPGMAVEVVLNVGQPVQATADANGDARVSFAVQGDADAIMHLEVCDTLRRVIVVQRGQQAPDVQPTCSRTQIGGLFWLRTISTMVVDVAGPTPRMWLSQGPAPDAWLVDRPEGEEGPRRTAPLGLMAFGAAGLAKFSDATLIACGDVPDCSDQSGIALGAGAAIWITRFLGAEINYLKPWKLKIEGADVGYRFDSYTNVHILNISGLGGVPVGPVRIYGKGGLNYHRATIATTETIDDRTVTVDGVAVPVAGGTQSFGLRTAGWGWQFGGGLEGWINNRFAIYGEFNVIRLKGNDSDDVGEGRMDDHVTAFLGGVRVRIGG